VLALGVGVVLAARTRHWSDGLVLAEAAIVEALFPLALVFHASIHTSSLDFSPLVSGYGVPALLLFLPVVAAAGCGSYESGSRSATVFRIRS
jgi:hypothetical protein